MVVTDLPRRFSKETNVIVSTHGLSSSIIALNAHGFGQVLETYSLILKSLIFHHRLETKGVGRRH